VLMRRGRFRKYDFSYMQHMRPPIFVSIMDVVVYNNLTQEKVWIIIACVISSVCVVMSYEYYLEVPTFLHHQCCSI